ncbi:MAG TPA: enoyl-CoA hydratase/isomerase family protein [Candidatus Acidoferrales bacterium]|jgi:enoyl-CoA hydratase/carnithine racemase|nr:enoyl-CoA hydratase/isomerase family protein [Candidatus Acidoferrales bacterium]
MSEEVLYRANDGVGRITFNRPEARNAFTFRMYERLVEICKQACADPAIRVLVLSGVDETAFAAGTDISEFKKWSSAQDALDYEARINAMLDGIERIPLPTIAAVSGACTGGGSTIASCCDIRIGAANARFGVPISRTLGNCLSMANYVRLVALLGQARVKDIIFTGRLVEAEEARTIGLLSEVLPDFASLQTRADELARTLASRAPLTLRVTKEALRRIKEKMTPEEDSSMILACYMSHDFQEGMDAFLNKRKPKWTGA